MRQECEPDGRPSPQGAVAGEGRPIVIIGGGPAGTTVATLLLRHGRRVLLLERERFPRFHVGESLLPVTQHIWDRLGLSPSLEAAGFVRKTAGEIRLGEAPDRPGYFSSRMDFVHVPRGALKSRTWSYQVERAKFDHHLLRHAAACGVEIHEGARVAEVAIGAEPRVAWIDAAGERHVTEAAFVIDASGRHAFLARKLGLLRRETRYDTSAIFAHFKHVTWPEGRSAGFINVYFIEDGWVWFIPQANDVTSVGVVLNGETAARWLREPENAMRGILGGFAYLRVRFERAVQVAPVRTLRHLPYSATAFHGDGWALVGDAALFVDPVHSSGVHIAFYSGELLADAVHAHLGGDRRALAAYQKRLRRHHARVRTNVTLYYRVVVRYRLVARSFVWMTGKVFRDWSGPWLKRVSAWSFGHYSSYTLSMMSIWSLAFLGLAGCRVWHGLTGLSRWGRHGLDAAVKRPLDIPRSPEIQAAMRLSARSMNDGHIEPQVDAGVAPAGLP